eukprot:1240723-Prymnesium_polylepis.2
MSPHSECVRGVHTPAKTRTSTRIFGGRKGARTGSCAMRASACSGHPPYTPLSSDGAPRTRRARSHLPRTPRPVSSPTPSVRPRARCGRRPHCPLAASEIVSSRW